MTQTDDALHGRVVLTSDGVALGEITKLFVQADWHVRSFEVKLRRDAADRIGARRSMLHAGTLEIPTDVVQSVGDAVLLSVTADSLRRPAPERAPTPPA